MGSSAAMCPNCKTRFTEGICRICNNYSNDITWSRKCRKCYNAYQNEIKKKHYANGNSAEKRYRTKIRAVNASDFIEWRNKIRRLSYHTLTENEWVLICQHFSGCAMCDSDNISARSMLVHPKHGGKYCIWNVIPLCEECATELRRQLNPFEAFEDRISGNKHKHKRGRSRDNLKQILEWLDKMITQERQANETDK